MIWIFEDNKKSLLSQLFRVSFSQEIADKFVYTDGNGKLLKTLDEIFRNTTEKVIVFMDVIPGNRDITKIYRELCVKSEHNQNRAIIFPIVCSEYYFLRSIKDTDLVVDRTGIDECVNRRPYFHSERLKTVEDRKYCRNFEKYCKLVYKSALFDCARPEIKENDLFGFYYGQDCKCIRPRMQCEEKLLLIKSQEFIREYPLVPENDLAVEWDRLYELVNAFNRMVDCFIVADIENKNNYKKIRCMKNFSL